MRCRCLAACPQNGQVHGRNGDPEGNVMQLIQLASRG